MDWIEEESFPARPFSPNVRTWTRSELDNNSRDHVRLLGATISSDLSLDRRPIRFQHQYWLRKLRRVLLSLDIQSAMTPVHSFVSSHVLAGAPKAVTDKSQPVLNAAACVVSGIHKYDRGLPQLLHLELHWLDVAELVAYKLVVMAYGWLHGQAPQYLMYLCQPVFDVSSTYQLRSAARRVLFNLFGPLLSRWSAHRSGVYCQTVCEIRLLEETTSGAFKNALVHAVMKRLAY